MLLQRIEKHMRKMRMTPTRFGREAVGDPNFVTDLKDGRTCRSATEARVLLYIARTEAAGVAESPR